MLPVSDIAYPPELSVRYRQLQTGCLLPVTIFTGDFFSQANIKMSNCAPMILKIMVRG